ncbi:MAG TPA: ABC transporter ATP-binding protein [Methylomirabilota bacterium]|nr:ABC transporter ATP-binding protein [Methylomirabilota bacterium]
MRHLRKILEFGGPYLRKYLGRLVTGILLGVIFGLSSTLILGAANTLFQRLDPAEQEQAQDVRKKPLTGIKARVAEIKAELNAKVDPWLPLAGRHIDSKQVAAVLLILPLLFAFRGYIGYLSSYCMGWVSERVINDLRVDVLQKMNSLSLDFFNRSSMGDLVARVNMDTAALQKSLNLGFSDLIKEPVTIIGVYTFLFIIDWKLTLFVMVFLPACIAPIIVLGRKARKAGAGNVKASVAQANLLLEFLSGVRVVKAYALESIQLARFKEESRQLVHHGMKGIQAKELLNPIIETISALGIGILICYIFWSGRSLADMAIFLGGVASVYTPIKKLGNLHVMLQQSSIGVERLRGILSEQPTVKEPISPKPFSRFTRGIEFRGVTFAYGKEAVLQGIDLVIPAGHKLGIAGESGSGKSTLINLLFRFYDPTRGAVLIDGEDARELSSTALRSQMALVSQEIVLFDQTVAENIGLGKPGATQQEIEDAARAAHAHDFIRALPNGYQTRVGERGVMLSGGQRQRIAIARAFIRQAPILALDEATAALDAQSESEVQRALESIAANKTVICVAHRLSTLASMDEIIFMAQGRIVERGSFDSLLRANGGFAAMARQQGIMPRTVAA